MNTQRVEETAVRYFVTPKYCNDAWYLRGGAVRYRNATRDDRADYNADSLLDDLKNGYLTEVPSTDPRIQKLFTEPPTEQPAPLPLPDGAEVWDKDSIPKAIAYEIVRKDMIRGLDSIQEIGHSHQSISFSVWRFTNGKIQSEFVSYDENPGWVRGQSIDELVSETKTPRDSKRERISELRAELAKLEKEGV